MKTIIISPSGNLYGSEQVLIDYLQSGNSKHKVYVPVKSSLSIFLNKININYSNYFNLWLLYFSVIIDLLFRSYTTVYLNEAGHSKYISYLAGILKNKKFVIHIRLLEDCNSNRYPLGHLSNITFVTVSEFIANNFLYSSKVIHDGYNFIKNNNWVSEIDSTIKIGIIGRITKSKGFDEFISLFNHISNSDVEFHFYGDVSSDVELISSMNDLQNAHKILFHGFVESKDLIYSNINLVIHLNKQEPLGRIFFEALDYGIPLIGYHKGGIGEIVNTINYPHFVKNDDTNFNQQILGDLLNYKKLLFQYRTSLEIARENAKQYFSVLNYTQELNTLL